MQGAFGCREVDGGEAPGEGEEQQHRGQGEGHEGGDGTRIAGAQLADGDADLARGGAGQELAERHDIGIGLVAQPLAAGDEILAEVAEVSDGAAEARQPQDEEGEEDFGDWVAGGVAHARCVP